MNKQNGYTLMNMMTSALVAGIIVLIILITTSIFDGVPW